MIVRDFVPSDLSAILALGRSFAHAAGEAEVDDESLAMTCLNLAKGGILKVAYEGGVVGALGALVFPHYWNHSVMVAQELFWFVDREYRGTSAGLRLLSETERACQHRGATKLMMICLDNLEGDRVANIYRKRGYVPQERTFVKVL